MKYKICVAIPIKSGDIDVNKQIIENTLKNKPDLIEFRFDYINDIKIITQSFLKEIIDFVPPKIPKIFTFRRKQEGGQYDLNNHERIHVLKHLIEVKPDYLDIEISSESEVLKNIIELAYNNQVKLVFSYHNFEKSLSYKEITEILTQFNQKLSHELIIRSDKLTRSVLKIIVTAQEIDDNIKILNLCKKLSQQNKEFICFAMGEVGILSRLLCVKFGSLWTYGSSEDKTAPGQIKAEKIREIHQLLFEN